MKFIIAAALMAIVAADEEQFEIYESDEVKCTSKADCEGVEIPSRPGEEFTCCAYYRGTVLDLGDALALLSGSLPSGEAKQLDLCAKATGDIYDWSSEAEMAGGQLTATCQGPEGAIIAQTGAAAVALAASYFLY